MDAEGARRLMEDERAAIERLRRDRQRQQMLEDRVIDQRSADVGSEMFEREFRQSVGEMLDADLQEINAALRRLETGAYGRCEKCGRVIPDDRLVALPATRYCVAHADRHGRARQAGSTAG